MKLTWKNEPQNLSPQIKELIEELGIILCQNGISLYTKLGNALDITYSQNEIHLEYSSLSELCRGLSLLEGLTPNTSITQKPIFNLLGVMIDVSRGAVPRPDILKSILRKMATMGYNAMMLYTEETYPLPQEPWFGYMRGGYTKSQLKELDSYAKELGIELIPCIQCLAHLQRFLHWQATRKYLDIDDILLTDSSETQELLENMFSSIRECFSTDRIHVGMDEAMQLGLGRHLKEHGFEEPVKIMLRHVELICKLAEKYNFKPMMWSDMYFRLASKTGNYYDNKDISSNLTSLLPKSMQLVYWDYYHEDISFYQNSIKIHQKLDENTAFAGGGWNWISPITDFELFYTRSVPALKACAGNKVKEVWLTFWGDDGAEADIWSILLPMQAYAEFCFTGNCAISDVSARFKHCCKQDATPFLHLHLFHRPPKANLPICEVNAAKFVLYQDVLLGLLDADIVDWELENHYTALAKEYEEWEKQSKEPFSLLFKFYHQLAKGLALKGELGLKIRVTYQQKDKDAIIEIAKNKIPQTITEVEKLRNIWRELWIRDNNPIGFEVHDIRLGGVSARLSSAALRLIAYCRDEISTIEELETTPLPLLNSSGSLRGCYLWQEIVSACKL
jgi:glycosyl hydrolase, family 20